MRPRQYCGRLCPRCSSKTCCHLPCLQPVADPNTTGLQHHWEVRKLGSMKHLHQLCAGVELCLQLRRTDLDSLPIQPRVMVSFSAGMTETFSMSSRHFEKLPLYMLSSIGYRQGGQRATVRFRSRQCQEYPDSRKKCRQTFWTERR